MKNIKIFLISSLLVCFLLQFGVNTSIGITENNNYNQPSTLNVQKTELVDKGDHYFLSTGEKASFLRKKNICLIICDSKKVDHPQLSEKIQCQFQTELNVIKNHSLDKHVMVKIKEGKYLENIIPDLLQADSGISFISQVLTSSNKGGEIALTPNIIVSIKDSQELDDVVRDLQNYNLSLVTKLAFTDTEYEFKIDETIYDVGRIFEITREVAELQYINWAEPNFLVSPEFSFTPNDPLFNQQWHLHNTGQNGADVDADVDAPKAWSNSQGDGVVIAVIDGGVDLYHEDLNIFVNSNEELGDSNGDGFPGVKGVDDDGDGLVDEDSKGLEPGAALYTNDLINDDDENGYPDDLHGWNFLEGNNNPDSSDSNHGTAVAGVAGALGNNSLGVAGSAMKATILPIRIGFFNIPLSSIANAMRYAGKYADVVNNSWGLFTPSLALDSAIDDVVNGKIHAARRGGERCSNALCEWE